MMDPAYPDALPAQTRLHWYVVERVLGQGGFGITYLARDTNLDQRVAIKEYLPVEFGTRTGDGTIRPRTDELRDRYRWGLERFLQEARTLARFEHAHIVRVLSVFEFNNTAYMVMRYEEGANLGAVLDRRGTLPESELLAIVLPILDGLELIHGAGFVHRDIKPDNIYLRGNGQPVLLDFGSARQSTGSSHTLTILVAPGYAPFEQYYSDSGSQGPWTDIYGLGATCYRAIAGRPPLDAVARSKGILGSTQETMASASIVGAGRYSARLLAAVDHALAFAEKDRPQSIAEWRKELLASGAQAATAVPGASSKPRRDATAATAVHLPAPPIPVRGGSPETASQPRSPAPARTPWLIAAGALAAAAVVAVAYLLASSRMDPSAEIAVLRKEWQEERERQAARQAETSVRLAGSVATPSSPEKAPIDPVLPAGTSERATADGRPPASTVASRTAPATVPASQVPGKSATKDKAPTPARPVISTPPSPSGAPAGTPPAGAEPQAAAKSAEAREASGPVVTAKIEPPKPASLPAETTKPAPAAPPVPDPFVEAQRAYADGRYVEAVRLLRPLAAEGSSNAQLLLGEAYAEGRGVPRDLGEATMWIERTALQGNVEAMTRLGSMYATSGNRNFAYVWYGCAARLGSGPAGVEQARLASSLQPVERTQAERAIDACVAKGRRR